MDLDPHILHQILEKIKKQLMCPQCQHHMEAECDAMRLCGEDFVVFQMQCPHCEAHIVLHATIAGMHTINILPNMEKNPIEASNNVSTSIHMESEEISILRKSIQEAEGSFSKMFQR